MTQNYTYSKYTHTYSKTIKNTKRTSYQAGMWDLQVSTALLYSMFNWHHSFYVTPLGSTKYHSNYVHIYIYIYICTYLKVNICDVLYIVHCTEKILTSLPISLWTEKISNVLVMLQRSWVYVWGGFISYHVFIMSAAQCSTYYCFSIQAPNLPFQQILPTLILLLP